MCASTTSSFWSEKLEKVKSRFTYKAVATNNTPLDQQWKPITLKFPFLAVLLLITLAMIAALECVHFMSKGYNAGGVTFAASPDEISSTATFLYLYLPNLLVVLYAMVWTWVDLDVKRLEPWFQLSRPEGATAEDSILLHYPFDFGPFVPYKSAYRKHWAVFLSSSAAVLVSLVVVPLQAAIFTTDTVSREVQAMMVIDHALAPVHEQSSLLGTHFLATAYGASWLEQRMPPYTTKEFALEPFSIRRSGYRSTSNETWTATTRMYWTNLTCVRGMSDNPGLRLMSEEERKNISISATGPTYGPGRRSPQTGTFGNEILIDTEGGPYQWNFDDENGCRLENFSIHGGHTNVGTTLMETHLLQYIPVSSAPSKTCPQKGNNIHKSLLIASIAGAQEVGTPNNGENSWELQRAHVNVSAFFCHPSYYTRSVDATVQSSSGEVVRVSKMTEPHELSTEDFNVTAFEYTIGYGISATPLQPNLPDTVAIEHFPRLLNANISLAHRSVSQVLGNALALHDPPYNSTNFQLESGPNLELLEKALTKGHQLLFSAAISQLIIARNSTTHEPAESPYRFVSGRVSNTTFAIVYVRLYAIIIEICLVATSIVTCLSWVYSMRRNLNLHYDPGSISQVMALVKPSHALLLQFRDYGSLSKRQLAERSHGLSLHLKTSGEVSSPSTMLDISHQEGYEKDFVPKTAAHEFKAVRPWELSFGAAFTGILVLAGALSGIIYIFTLILRTDGISQRPSDATVRAILENGIPVAFGSLLEPSWTIFNRLTCALQPFKDMDKNNASSTRTVKAKYTTVPPPLAILGALQLKHYLLALVCAATLSTNALQVSLGGLFTDTTKRYSFMAEVEKLYSGSLNQKLITPDQSSLGLNPINRLNGGAGNVLGNRFHDHFRRFIVNASGEAPLPHWVDNNFYYLPFAIPEVESFQRENADTVISAYSSITKGFGATLSCNELTTSGNTRVVFEIQDDDSIIYGIVNDDPTPKKGGSLQRTICAAIGGDENAEVPIDAFGAGRKFAVSYGDSAPGLGVGGFAIPEGGAAVEGFTSMEYLNGTNQIDDGGFCKNLLVAMWGRLAPRENSQTERLLSTRFLACRPSFMVGTFNVTVTSSSTLISAQKMTDTADVDLTTYQEGFLGELNRIIALVPYTESVANTKQESNSQFVWHENSLTQDWFSSAIAAKMGTNRFVDPNDALPSVEEAIAQTESVYRSLAALYFSFDKDIFLKSDAPSVQQVNVHYTQQRLVMKGVMFWISVSALVLQIMALVLYCFSPHKKFLPRMPITIASTIADVAASHATQIAGTRFEHRIRYGYGSFMGTDGANHIGIEEADKVRPLASQ